MEFGYARISTAQQNVDRQEDALAAAGIAAENIFTDVVSGSRSQRPGLDALMSKLRDGDALTVHALDRLGRDTRQLLTWVAELEQRGVALRILTLGVDMGTGAGRLVLTMMAALASLEREILVERTVHGLAAARARGRVGGRPPALSAAQRCEVERLLSEGRPSGDLAALFSVSPRTIRRVKALTLPVAPARAE